MDIPDLPSQEALRLMKVFPYTEGTQWEFKQSASDICLNKLEKTLCAFLNTSGGHLVFGIIDKTLELNWLSIHPKELDKVKLRIDNIYQQQTIKTLDNKAIQLGYIKTTIFTSYEKKYIIVVTAIPTPGITYVHNHHIYHRLNASNYYLQQIQYVTKWEMDHAINNENMKIIEQCKRDKQKLSKENDIEKKKIYEQYTDLIKKQQEYIHQLESKQQKLSKENDEYIHQLELKQQKLSRENDEYTDLIKKQQEYIHQLESKQQNDIERSSKKSITLIDLVTGCFGY